MSMLEEKIKCVHNGASGVADILEQPASRHRIMNRVLSKINV